MDLLERGRSLGDLGKSLRWTDMRAFLKHLPVDSFTAAALDPDGIRDRRLFAELSTPRAKLVAAVHDSLESALLGLAGAQADVGIISRIAKYIIQGEGPKAAGEAKPSPEKRRGKSATEIRALVAARTKK